MNQQTFSTEPMMSLLKDLAGYGLNPADWDVVAEDSQFYEVISKNDFNFRFRGKVEDSENTVPKWQMLRLKSL